jgi:DNA-binding NarL/FixJ family response regulator
LTASAITGFGIDAFMRRGAMAPVMPVRRKRLIVVVDDIAMRDEIRQILAAEATSAAASGQHAAVPMSIAAVRGSESLRVTVRAATERLAGQETTRRGLAAQKPYTLVVISKPSAAAVIAAIRRGDAVAFENLNLHHLPLIVGLMQARHLAVPAAALPLIVGAGLRRQFLLELTSAERHVLHLLSYGCSNRTIASSMRINEGRTKYLIRSLLRKLMLQNRTQAAVLAAREFAPLMPPLSHDGAESH